ncbi:MAG TPA: START domain-containing protein [Chthoniobacterales bacterium]|nr:START domain-containing protein [Chthoniobacterales bacterium]
MTSRNLLCLIFALTICCCGLTLTAAEPEAVSSEWKLVLNSDNVELSRRQRALSNESRAIGEIAAPVEVVHAVIDDLESYPKFMPYTAECRVLKRDRNSVLAYQRISAPLTSDRDYTVRVRTSSKPVEKGTSYFSRWETDNSLGPPEKPGIVRVKLCEGSWLLEPSGPNTTRATYTIYTDSGGAIPAFIKNTGSQIGIRKMFAAVRKQVRDPKYGAAAKK